MKCQDTIAFEPQHGAPRNLGVSKFPEKVTQKLLKVTPEPTLEKPRDLVFVLGRKGSEKKAPRTLPGSLFLDLWASKRTLWTAATKSKRESLAQTPAKDPAKDPRRKSGPPKRTTTISGAAVSRKRPKYNNM